MTDAKNVAWILVIEDEWNFARKQRTQRFWKLRSVGFFGRRFLYTKSVGLRSVHGILYVVRLAERNVKLGVIWRNPLNPTYKNAAVKKPSFEEKNVGFKKGLGLGDSACRTW